MGTAAGGGRCTRRMAAVACVRLWCGRRPLGLRAEGGRREPGCGGAPRTRGERPGRSAVGRVVGQYAVVSVVTDVRCGAWRRRWTANPEGRRGPARPSSGEADAERRNAECRQVLPSPGRLRRTRPASRGGGVLSAARSSTGAACSATAVSYDVRTAARWGGSVIRRRWSEPPAVGDLRACESPPLPGAVLARAEVGVAQSRRAARAVSSTVGAGRLKGSLASSAAMPQVLLTPE